MSKPDMAKFLITDVKKGARSAAFPTEIIGKPAGVEHVVWLDDTVITGARIYSECSWFMPGVASKTVPEGKEHSHDFEEVLAFFGSDNDKPRDLCGELEIWLAGVKHTITRTSLIFIPRGMKHCPATFRKIDKPIFHFSIGSTNQYSQKITETFKIAGTNKAAQKTDKYIVDYLQPPKVEAPWSPNPPPAEAEKGKGGRILFLDNDVIPDGFYTECVWIMPFKGPLPKMTDEMLEKARAAVKPHKHDFDEVLCFFGANPRNQFKDLDAEIELWLGGEKFMITKSTMVYIPANVEHCPLVFHRVGSPIIHFTCFPEGKIYFTGLKKTAKK